MDRHRWAALVAVAILTLTGHAEARPAKVEVCHIPAGDPMAFHTIRVSERALAAHLRHGDLTGRCAQHCEVLCNDGNACTVDACVDGQCTSTPASVDCDDGNPCTADMCDPQGGCQNAPLPGQACDDGVACTGADTCDTSGTCTGAPISGCCTVNLDCDDGNACTTNTCNPNTHRCEAVATVCAAPDACTTSECDPTTGACVDAAIVCDDFEPCTDDSCDPVLGCAAAPITCDDAIDCTADQCIAGACHNDDSACNPPCSGEGGALWLSGPMASGWNVDLVSSGLIPHWEVTPSVEHRVSFALADGRTFEFVVTIEVQPNTLSSLIPVRPAFTEVTSTGATLSALNDWQVPYSVSSYDLFTDGTNQVIFADLSLEPWEPAYWQIQTAAGETFVFSVGDHATLDVADQCGVCGGDSATCLDCLDVPNGSAALDACSVCNGDNSTCADCNGVPNGGAVVDTCGVCGGDGSSCACAAGTIAISAPLEAGWTAVQTGPLGLTWQAFSDPPRLITITIDAVGTFEFEVQLTPTAAIAGGLFVLPSYAQSSGPTATLRPLDGTPSGYWPYDESSLVLLFASGTVLDLGDLTDWSPPYWALEIDGGDTVYLDAAAGVAVGCE